MTLAMLLAAVVAAGSAPAPAAAPSTPLDALKAAFNDKAGTVRVITLLSPT